MSGYWSKSQFRTMHRAMLPPHAKLAYLNIRARLARRDLPARFNNEKRELPKNAAGCIYVEAQVGEDRQGHKGEWRLLCEINEKSLEIMEIYFTKLHYYKGSIWRVLS